MRFFVKIIVGFLKKALDEFIYFLTKVSLEVLDLNLCGGLVVELHVKVLLVILDLFFEIL